MRLTQELIDITPEEDNLPLHVIHDLINNKEIQAVQDYANKVSITRLGYNDHGPVHMRTVCHNALRMLKLLYTAGIPTTLQTEQVGTFDDSVTAVALASFCHDFGMTIGRQDHELYSGILAYNIIDGILQKNLPNERDLMRRVVIRSTAMEGILGHMGTRKVHSIEAGIVLIADGCDMTKGRGKERPIQIIVQMSAEVGLFQIEEVLLPKINSSPAKEYIELYACVEGEEPKRYL